MTATAPNTTGSEADYERLLPEWTKRCVEAQNALSALFEIQSEFEEVARACDYARPSPASFRELVECIEALDLENMGDELRAAEPEYELLGEAGRRVVENDLISRATSAWVRSGGRDQPSASSAVRIVSGRRYVELSNVNGVLAVYKVSRRGNLKRVRSVPRAPQAAGQVARGVARDLPIKQTLDAFRLDRGDPQFIDEEEDRALGGE